MVKSCPHSLYFFRGDVENLVLEDAVNTFKDWHIVPLGRPTISPPQQKTTILDIPGANGVIDLSNSLTGYPVFNNRTGSMTFAVLNDETDWLTAYTKILRFLQGNPIKMILEDDPKYFYEGSVYVEDWNSRNDGTWSEVTLGYDLYPYRKRLTTSIGDVDWLWDPFNFETDFIQSSAFNAIQINTVDDEWKVCDFTGIVDTMPATPILTVTLDGEDPITAQLYNSDLHYEWKEFSLTAGTYKLYDLILCEETPESIVKMRFKGHGQVTINFRSGRL